MPILMLMRHGKSNWDGSWASDHERPLAPRGIRAASLMGRFLRENGHQPTIVVSSTATRAATTAQLAADGGHWNSEIVFEDRLYGSNPEIVFDIVRSLDPAYATVLLVGHNPTWEQTSSLLIGGGHIRFPTAAIACFEIEGAWTHTRPGQADLRWFVTPRSLEK